MKNRTEIIAKPDLATLSEAAAAFCAACAASAVTARGRFAIALTGGSSPRRLYELLAAPPWRTHVDWASWHVFWGDDRMVPPDHPDSNFRLAHETLLAHVPIPEAQIHRIPTEVGDRDHAARAYEAELRAFFPVTDEGWPHFDLVLLGLGADGHVASLFPGFPTLDESRRWVVGSPPGTLPPPIDRVTLTMPVLNAARKVAFIVAGADKALAVQRALRGDWDVPAARVQPTDGSLHWFLDTAAASLA
jgi:6-phosphogluconolactonase